MHSSDPHLRHLRPLSILFFFSPIPVNYEILLSVICTWPFVALGQSLERRELECVSRVLEVKRSGHCQIFDWLKSDWPNMMEFG